MTDDDAASLRGRALMLLRAGPGAEAASDPDLPRLLHELDVYRVELEVQNAELRQARIDLEEALARSKLAERERLTLALGLERSADAIFLTAPDGCITYVNPAFERLYGFSAAEAIGMTPRILKSGRLDAAHYEQLWASLLAGRVVTGDVVNRTKDGTLVEVHTSVNPILDGDTVLGYLAIQRDVTERNALQARLYAAESMASVGTLAAGVAHEINNPLAYVIANLDFISRELQAVAGLLPAGRLSEVGQVLGEAQEGAERVRLIVRDLKTFSRSDAEQRGPVKLLAVLDSAVQIVWSEIKHRATLVKDYGDVPLVIGNEAKLGQVFLNLLVNAAQAIGEGAASENQIRLVARTDGSGRAVIEVHDTGCGIPPEHLGRIFDAFYTTKPIGIGTGLGLSVSRNTVLAAGGEILVESTPGKGTVFRIVLPPAPAAPPAGAA